MDHARAEPAPVCSSSSARQVSHQSTIDLDANRLRVVRVGVLAHQHGFSRQVPPMLGSMTSDRSERILVKRFAHDVGGETAAASHAER
jgi:hypothetical protein